MCGKEIDDLSSHARQKPDESSVEQQGNEHGGFGSAADPANCIDCCACFVEMERRAQQQQATQHDAGRKLSVNVDNFFMDSYGNLPKTAEIVDESGGEPSGVCAATVSSRRACSPNTSRVIRITLNNKSAADGKK